MSVGALFRPGMRTYFIPPAAGVLLAGALDAIIVKW